MCPGPLKFNAELPHSLHKDSAFTPLPDVEFAQRSGHTQAGSGVGGVLKARDGGLACRRLLPHIIAVL
jgi:hypothetical protein